MFLALCCLPLASASAQDSAPLLLAVSARQPALDALPSGDCALAWIRQESATSIEFRRREARLWQPVETPCPPEPGVLVSQPRVRLDSAGNAHLAWVSAQAGTFSLQYAFRTGDTWSRFGALDEPSSRRIEHPVLALRPPNGTTRHTDEVFVAWQERSGSNYRIRAFVMDSAAETHAFVLAGEEAPQYAVYPTLLEIPSGTPGAEPRMALCWFNLDEPDTRIEMRIWDDAQSQWTPGTAGWESDSLRVLPLMLSNAGEEPFLLGIDAADQVYITLEENLRYHLTDNRFVRNRFPQAGKSAEGAFGLVWQQETSAGVELIQAALRPGVAIYASPLAATGDPFLPSEPAVALSENAILSVWIGSAIVPETPGQTPGAARIAPGIFFSETQIPDAGWRPLALSAE